MPESLRLRARSDFPEFEILDAESSVGAGPGEVTEQDVKFYMRHKQRPFYISVEYDRQYRGDGSDPDWMLNESDRFVGGLSFKGRLDPRARGFVQFFSARYPRGEFILEGVDYQHVSSARDRYPVWLFPRSLNGGLVVLANGQGHAEVFVHDPNTGTWSEEQRPT